MENRHSSFNPGSGLFVSLSFQQPVAISAKKVQRMRAVRGAIVMVKTPSGLTACICLRTERQFGQLLEIDVLGDIEYYYNVTNVIPAIDRERSEVLPGGFVKKAALDESLIPAQVTVFKDAVARSSIFVNDAAKSELEKQIVPMALP